ASRRPRSSRTRDPPRARPAAAGALPRAVPPSSAHGSAAGIQCEGPWRSPCRLAWDANDSRASGRWPTTSDPPASGVSIAQQGGETLDGLADVLDRVGVGEADVALPVDAEAGAGHRCHAGGLQHLVLQLARVQAGAGDVGE